MAAPAFGFSIGDFIAAIKVITRISEALKYCDGAAGEYQSLLRELKQLQLVLEQLHGLPRAPFLSKNHYNAGMP